MGNNNIIKYFYRLYIYVYNTEDRPVCLIACDQKPVFWHMQILGLKFIHQKTGFRWFKGYDNNDIQYSIMYVYTYSEGLFLK